jgi:hypothetical protein
MNRDLAILCERSEGRYPSPDEQERLRAYAEGLVTRLDVMDAVRNAEEAILEDVANAVLAKDPQMVERHGATASKKMQRDYVLVLRYASLAALNRDADFIHDKLAVWFRTIMFALCDAELVLFGAHQLVESCKKHLSEADSAEVTPYIQVVIDELEMSRSIQ